MRDPKRIDAFCENLAALWKECPDWRFGQLVVNVLGTDPFYIEDNESYRRVYEWRQKMAQINEE